MEINFSKLKSIGNFALFGGTAQLISTFIIGYFFASILGMSNIEAIYIGIIICFSSTMVVLKLLSDRRELDNMRGRLSLGILLLQEFRSMRMIESEASLVKHLLHECSLSHTNNLSGSS